MSEIDNQIKRSLSGYEAPFDPNDWKEMEKLLDKKKRRKALWIWFLGASMLLGAAGTVTSVFFANPTTTMHKTTTPTLTLHSLDEKNDANSISTINTQSNNQNILPTRKAQSTAEYSQTSVSTHNTSAKKVRPTKTNTIRQATSEKLTSPLLQENEETTSSATQFQHKGKHDAHVPLAKANLTSIESERTNANPGDYTTTSILPENIDTLPLLNISLFTEQTPQIPDTTKRHQTKKKTQQLRWFMEGNGGFNAPFIKNSSFAKFEPDANLLLGVQFKRWRFYTGIGYSQTHIGFDLKKDDLAVQATDSSILSFVDISQRYLNIPLGISFSIIHRSKVDLYVTATLLNHVKISNSRKGTYKNIVNILLMPDSGSSYAILDITTQNPYETYQGNTTEKTNEVNRLLNSPILSADKYFIGGKFSVGFSYKITPSLYWNIEGYYSIVPKLNNRYGNKMDVGGNTGFRYYFR